jgi:glutamine synthetase
MLISAARRLTASRLSGSTVSRVATAAVSRRHFISSADDFGTHLFSGATADEYLIKQGLPAGTLDDPKWTTTSADKVAAAVMDWAHDKGATVYTHWFQPMGASGLRHGLTGQVQNAMFSFGADGKVVHKLKGSDLLKGETDGSSYPNGGMRATHTAGGYTIIDATSPIFLRGDTVFVPTVFVSFHGDALDEKTPLLRSMRAVSDEGVRLLKHLGMEVKGLQPNIGLEQEFFLVPRKDFYRRPDLQMAGRTVLGKNAPRGQETCDHYMSAINPVAMACMQEVQHECFMLGIPLRTRHREVAPNQYEFAPLFGLATTQIDQNLMVMQILEEVAARHGLAALIEEKPFNDINGSGKHNNFSLGTDTGVNLLNVGQVTQASGNPALFPMLMACIVRAVDLHGDLMRMAIASPGNDFRLGACEAPPAITSTYLGESLTSYLEEAMKTGTFKEYVPQQAQVDLGIPTVAPFTVPAEDRNRTSPFPFGGHRFEFRAVGSAQNVSMVNTVLCSIFADSFAEMSRQIEGGKQPAEVATSFLKTHWKCIMNGDNYSEAWPIEAGKRGVWRIDSGVEAMKRISEPKNVALFEGLKVLSKKECEARAEVMHDHYSGYVEIEAGAMLDMLRQHVIPSVKAADLGAMVPSLEAAAASVEKGLHGMHAAPDAYAKATLARVLRLETMIDARAVADKAEAAVPADLWTLATYSELLFLDKNQGAWTSDEE